MSYAYRNENTIYAGVVHSNPDLISCEKIGVHTKYFEVLYSIRVLGQWWVHNTLALHWDVSVSGYPYSVVRVYINFD